MVKSVSTFIDRYIIGCRFVIICIVSYKYCVLLIETEEWVVERGIVVRDAKKCVGNRLIISYSMQQTLTSVFYY